MNQNYKRVLLKLSGEALFGNGINDFSNPVITKVVNEIYEISSLGVELAVVVGGGNLMRGNLISENGVKKNTAHTIGILATVMNGMALADLLRKKGLKSRAMSAVYQPRICQFYSPEIAQRKLAKGEVIVIGGGTGNSYFSTDTAAALYALELECQVLLKATKVDGVYSDDPMKNQSAKKFDQISYQECLSDNLKVMDSTAISLCKDNNLKIIVFNIGKEGELKRTISGNPAGTIIC